MGEMDELKADMLTYDFTLRWTRDTAVYNPLAEQNGTFSHE
jgi:hypothetical protein